MSIFYYSENFLLMSRNVTSLSYFVIIVTVILNQVMINDNTMIIFVIKVLYKF